MALRDFTLDTKSSSSIPLKDIHLSTENKTILNQLLKEYKYSGILNDYGLPINNKVLLFGLTGCGKTTTAIAIAEALEKKILILNLGQIVSSRLGETAKNITEVFKQATRENAVLFIDEFDYIGKKRDYDNSDSGEMKRLVNTVIQLIDQLSNESLLIAATNNSNIIDTALLRRFQLKLRFEAPSIDHLNHYYDSILMQFPIRLRNIKRNYSISYAEAKDNTFKSVKNQIIEIEEAKELALIKK